MEYSKPSVTAKSSLRDRNENFYPDVSSDFKTFNTTSSTEAVDSSTVLVVSDQTINDNDKSDSDTESFFEDNLIGSSSSYFSLRSSIFQEKTLFEMASEFRSQNPDKWYDQEMERQKRIQGSNSKEEKIDSFLDEYYERQNEIQKEKKAKDLRSKFEVNN